MPFSSSLEAVRSAVRISVVGKQEPPEKGKAKAGPAVTISRQTGADAVAVSHHLVDLLNRYQPGPQPWLEYDRRLVERVAADHSLSEDLVARLSERDKSWFEHFTGGLTFSRTGTDVAMKTFQTIRALAQVGRAVIVGRGGQCVLAGVPNVLHVRLVAPLDARMKHYAQTAGLSESQAAQAVTNSDTERARFLRNHFRQNIEDPTLYHLVINVAWVPADEAAELIARLVETNQHR